MNFTKHYQCIERLTSYAGSELQLTTKAVYFILLAFHENNVDAIFPSQDEIADRLGVSEGSIKRAIATLVKIGWINSKRRPNTSNLYTIALTPDQIVAISEANNWNPEPRARFKQKEVEPVQTLPVSEPSQGQQNDDLDLTVADTPAPKQAAVMDWMDEEDKPAPTKETPKPQATGEELDKVKAVFKPNNPFKGNELWLTNARLRDATCVIDDDQLSPYVMCVIAYLHDNNIKADPEIESIYQLQIKEKGIEC